jgi:hypothetical protein
MKVGMPFIHWNCAGNLNRSYEVVENNGRITSKGSVGRKDRTGAGLCQVVFLVSFMLYYCGVN